MKANISLGLAIFWGIFTIAVMFQPKLRESVTLVFFLSGYAIVVAHLAEWAAHRAEEKQDGD